MRKQQFIQVKHELDQEVHNQEEYNIEIQNNIQQALKTLKELMKESKTLAMSEDVNQASGQGKKGSKDPKKDEEVEVDIDYIMEDIRKDVSKIYTICFAEVPATVRDAKLTIDILQEIELKFIEYMKQIQYIHD